MTLRKIVLMSVLVAIGIPVTQSHAKLPKPKSHAIVPGKSIGGVKLGGKYKTVQKTWGRNRSCDGKLTFTCYYNGPLAQGGADVIQIGNRVRSVEIGLGTDSSGKPVFGGALLKFKTKAGIGLGSTQAQVVAAYPSATLTAFDVLTLSTGSAKTTFGLYNGLVYKIGINK